MALCVCKNIVSAQYFEKNGHILTKLKLYTIYIDKIKVEIVSCHFSQTFAIEL